MTATAQPLISVVITCYNYARYVAEAIDSALGQDYPNKEVIVVNDGSTDGSLAIIARFQGRIEIVDKPNGGCISAYNRGFEASRGEIVIFLDADDKLEPNALGEVARAWSPACSKVQYDLRIIDAEGLDLGRRFCNFTADYDARAVAKSFAAFGTYRWPVTVGNAYARAFAREVFPLEPGNYPDGVLNTLAPLYGAVVTIARPLACYRLHGANGWSLGSAVKTKLPQLISHRAREFGYLQEHARRLQKKISESNPLDHEIAFLNYRLMAHRLGLEYEGKAADTTASLARSAYQLLARDRYPAHMTLSYALWFAAMAVVPERTALWLIQLRFSRAELKKELRSRARKLVRGSAEATAAR
jgi:hypothetical protein